MSIGDRIKSIRIEKRMTQEALAKKIGTSKQNISRYENGDVKDIPMKQVGKIADALDTTPAYLVFGKTQSLIANDDDAYNPFYDDSNDAYGTDIEWRKRHGRIDDNPRLQRIVDLLSDCDDATLDRVIAIIEVLV